MICFPLDNTPYEAKDMGTYLACLLYTSDAADE